MYFLEEDNAQKTPCSLHSWGPRIPRQLEILGLETRPIAPSTASFYLQSREALQPDLDRLADTAVAIGARYWLVAPDDYQLEHADTFLRDATSDLLRSAPVTYQTEDGAVRIHDLSAGL